jgi:hypothetical protein
MASIHKPFFQFPDMNIPTDSAGISLPAPNLSFKLIMISALIGFEISGCAA